MFQHHLQTGATLFPPSPLTPSLSQTNSFSGVSWPYGGENVGDTSFFKDQGPFLRSRHRVG